MPAASSLKKFIQVCLPVLALALCACGSEKHPAIDPPKNTVKTEEHTNQVPEACTSTSCNPGQYCLQAQTEDNKVVDSRCVAVPAECDTCDCVKQDGLKQYQEAKHCRNAGVYCANPVPGTYLVSCVKF